MSELNKDEEKIFKLIYNWLEMHKNTKLKMKNKNTIESYIFKSIWKIC